MEVSAFIAAGSMIHGSADPGGQKSGREEIQGVVQMENTWIGCLGQRCRPE